MAASKYRLSRHAVADLEGIASYLQQRSPTAARRVIGALQDTFELLARNRQMGTSLDEIRPGLRLSISRRPADKCVVLHYSVADGILISDVIHSARDWVGMLEAGER
jgi:plasmid stabilization system protein ParE